MENGMITADQVQGAINDPEFYHNPLTSLVCVENTPQIKVVVLATSEAAHENLAQRHPILSIMVEHE
jgi:threonine aldolase